MANEAAKLTLPIFARASTLSVLQEALDTGVLKNLNTIAYILTLDDNHLYHVSKDKVLRCIVGDNPEYVKRLSSLPSPEDASVDALYIVGNVGYVFDGEAFHSLTENLDNTIADLSDRVDAVETAVASHSQTIAQLQEDVEILPSLSAAVSTNTTNIASLQQNKADKATTLAGYGIADAYTKDEIDALVNTPVDPETGQPMNVTTYVSDSINEALGLDII